MKLVIPFATCLLLILLDLHDMMTLTFFLLLLDAVDCYRCHFVTN